MTRQHIIKRLVILVIGSYFNLIYEHVKVLLSYKKECYQAIFDIGTCTLKRSVFIYARTYRPQGGKLIHARESVRTFESAERESVMLRNAVRMLVVGLALSTMALGAPSAQASVRPVTKQQPIVLMAAKTGNPPTGDCISMATLVLGGLAVRAGASAYTVGRGAIYANSSSLIGSITGVVSSYSCLNYLVPRYIDMICVQSRQGLRFRKTWEARALITFATLGRKNRC
jgi:hypothetical protein